MKKIKVLIIGHARHGKDTSAEIIKELFNYTFESSSVAAARIFLFDALRDRYGYGNFIECFDDRVNRRAEWFNAIKEYNSADRSRLAKEILTSSDMYLGMRSEEEFTACVDAGIFDLVIGIYDPRKQTEPKSSFDIDLWQMSDIIIPNSEDITQLRRRLKLLEPIFCRLNFYNE